MKAHKMSPVEPGNPFLSDIFHMGTYLGSNVAVMYAKHVTERQKYLIVVDLETGKRIHIDMEERQ